MSEPKRYTYCPETIGHGPYFAEDPKGQWIKDPTFKIDVSKYRTRKRTKKSSQFRQGVSNG